MKKNEKKLIRFAAILYLVLILLIYFGSFLKHMLNYSWYGSASAIAVIFIWVTIFIFATIVMAKALFLIKERLRGKERLDFTARLGVMIADYSKSGKKIGIDSFFAEVCKENGIMNVPDLKKYFGDNKLIGDRESVFEKLRQEIEESAEAWSREKNR